jgi:hypothetical protein
LRRVLTNGSTHLTLTVIVIIAALVLGGSGCGGNADSNQISEATTGGASDTTSVTIRVTGTSGTPFKGSYGLVGAGTESVEGVIPQDYEISYNEPASPFLTVKASMQKRVDDDREITVQIIVDGETKAQRTTGAGFGVAKVSWHPSEQ